MTKKRYNRLMDDLNARLTKEEVVEGWHFCCEWDGLLIGPGMEQEIDCGCTCFPPDHSLYDFKKQI